MLGHCYFMVWGRTAHHSRDIALKRVKLGLPHKPEVAMRSFPVCTNSLMHAGLMLFYDFGPYDLPFSRYCPMKTQIGVATYTGNGYCRVFPHEIVTLLPWGNQLNRKAVKYLFIFCVVYRSSRVLGNITSHAYFLHGASR